MGFEAVAQKNVSLNFGTFQTKRYIIISSNELAEKAIDLVIDSRTLEADLSLGAEAIT